MDQLTEPNQTSMSVSTSLIDTDAKCVKFNIDDEEMLQFNVFWVEGVTLTVTAVAGILCNVVSIFILSKEDLHTFFSYLLIVLSSFDSLYLLLSIIEAFRRSFKLISQVHIYLFPYFLYPFHSLIMASSIYMTIAIAVERFRAVITPISIRQSLISKRMYKRRLLKYLFPVMLCAVTISIPRFFELKLVIPSEDAKTKEEESGPQLGLTSLRTDPVYNIYYVNLTRFLLTGGGPIVLLVFFYFRIFWAVHRHNVVQLQVTSSQLDEATRQKQENALAKLFINIIVAFIVCHLPRVLINIYEMTVIDIAVECFEKGMSAYGNWVNVTICYSHLLLVINASINIIFYIWHNKTFKEHFLAMIGRQPSSRSQTTATAVRSNGPKSKERKTVDFVQIEVHI